MQQLRFRRGPSVLLSVLLVTVDAFVGALSDGGTFDKTVPDSVPSGLAVGGNLAP